MERIESSKPDIPFESTDYYNLGSYHRSVTSSNDDAKLWFSRGLIWTYAFNHEEAAECFTRAITSDPTCAMAYWGLAYTLGPNYNKPWEVFDEEELESTLKKACHAVNQAKENCASALPTEKALIEALQLRYPQITAGKPWSKWNQNYSNAMASVYERFPDDLDVVALHADALMNLTPWKLWDVSTGKPVEGARTIEIKAILDRALTLEHALSHPGILHLYIHLMEMSPNPEDALSIADNLRNLVPDAGHLQHMPTHLDVLCGDYRRAIASNGDAICADNRFFSNNSSSIFYSLYRCHDFHFRIYAAMLSGQSRIALETVGGLEKALTRDLLRVKSPPMADWLEGFLAMRVHVLVRFGFWDDIIAMPLPSEQDLYYVTVAMIHYAKTIALSVTAEGLDNLDAAYREREKFNAAVQRVPDSRTLFNNTCRDILRVAEAMLDGELEYRRQMLLRGDKTVDGHASFDLAFSHLKEAIARDDALPYDEPWGWMQPTRHAYGALLVEQGQIEMAAAIYSADLGLNEGGSDTAIPRALQHPNNVWSLHGYHECLVILGRTAEARLLAPQLTLALAVADVDIKSSCFCRLSTKI